MLTEFQIAIARTFMEQARAAALQAHESWRMVLESQKGIRDSLKSAGIPIAEAMAPFDQLLEMQSAQYKNALDQMEKMTNAYTEMLERFKVSM